MRQIKEWNVNKHVQYLVLHVKLLKSTLYLGSRLTRRVVQVWLPLGENTLQPTRTTTHGCKMYEVCKLQIRIQYYNVHKLNDQ